MPSKRDWFSFPTSHQKRCIFHQRLLRRGQLQKDQKKIQNILLRLPSIVVELPALEARQGVREKQQQHGQTRAGLDLKRKNATL